MKRILAFVIATVLLGGIAASQPTCATRDQGEVSSALDLTSAERIYVRVQGFPDLSSEYRVNADNTISIPVIGRVSVAGVTPSCLEEILSASATKIAKREVFLTVETIAYKPVYITGAVSRPGATPWFPGMTVLHATTLAGGLFRQQLGALATPDPAKIRRLTDNQRRLQARLARLKAELAGETTLTAPPDLSLASANEVRDLFKAEEVVLASRQAALQNSVSSLERSMALAQEELASLQQTRKRLDEQLEIRRSLRDKIQGLQQKGLVRLDRALEEDLRVADLEQRVLDNSVARARLSATLAGLERESGGLSLGRRATLGIEISDLERDLAQNTIDLQGARLAAGSPAQTDGEDPVTFTIIRGTGEKSRRIKAVETDALQVGDVLFVALSVQ